MSKKVVASDKVPLQSKSGTKPAESDDDDQEMGMMNAPDPIPRLAQQEDTDEESSSAEGDTDDEEAEDDDSNESDNPLAVRNRKAPFSFLFPANPLHVLNLGALFAFFLLCAVVVVSLSTLGAQVITRKESAAIVLEQHSYVGALQRLDFAIATIYEYLLFGDSLLLAKGAETTASARTVVVNKKAVSLSTSAKYVVALAEGMIADATLLAELAQRDEPSSTAVASAIGSNYSTLLKAVDSEIRNVVIPFAALTYQQRAAFHSSQKGNRQLLTSNINNIDVATGVTKGMTILRSLIASCSSFPACNTSGALDVLNSMANTYVEVVAALEDSTSQFLQWIDSPQVSPSLDVSSAVAYLTPLVVQQASDARTHAYLTLAAQTKIRELIAARATSETLGNASAAVQAIAFVSSLSDLEALDSIAALVYTALMSVRANVKNWASSVQVAWINLGVARRFDFSTPFFPASKSDTDAAGGLKYVGSPLVDPTGYLTYNMTILSSIKGNTSLVTRFAKVTRAGILAAIAAEQKRTEALAATAQASDPVADAATWKIQVAIAICTVLPALAVVYVLYGVSLRLASSPFPYSHFAMGLLFCYGVHIAVCVASGSIAMSAAQVPSILTSDFATETAQKTNVVLVGFDAANTLLDSALLVAPQPATLNATISATLGTLQLLDSAEAPWASSAIRALRDEQQFSIFARRDAIGSDGVFALRMAALKFSNESLCSDVLSLVLKQLSNEYMFSSWRRDELMLLRQAQSAKRLASSIAEAQAYRLDLCTQCGNLFPSDYCNDKVPLAVLSPTEDVQYRLFGPAGQEGTSVVNWRNVMGAITAQASANTQAVQEAFDNEQLVFTQQRRLIVWLSVFGIMFIQGVLYAISVRTFGPSASSMLP